MTAQLQMLHMRRCLCRCRFDVLKDVILFQKSANFIPASFIIEAEWGIPLPKSRSLKKIIPFENFLTMPPDNARILVVCFNFIKKFYYYCFYLNIKIKNY